MKFPSLRMKSSSRSSSSLTPMKFDSSKVFFSGSSRSLPSPSTLTFHMASSRSSTSTFHMASPFTPKLLNPFCCVSKFGKALRPLLPQWTQDVLGNVDQIRQVLSMLPAYMFRAQMLGVGVAVSSAAVFLLVGYLVWYLRRRMQAIDNMAAELAQLNALVQSLQFLEQQQQWQQQQI